MLNPAAAREYFEIRSGQLFRRLQDGAVRRIKSVRDGRIVTILHGEVYYGPDLAWTLYYGTTPMFPVFTLDGDPQNLSPENIVAARLKRLRYRERVTPSGLKHPLNTYQAFRSSDACRDNWLGYARAYYDADFGLIREMEAARAAMMPEPVYVRPPKDRAPSSALRAMARPPRPPAPACAAGYRPYWHDDQWVVVPEACHVADDYRVRCAAVLRGAVRFEFDAGLGRVVGFDAAGVAV